AAALERAQGRHEPGRPPAAAPSGVRAVHRVAAAEAVGDTGPDLPLADLRAQRHPRFRRVGPPRSGVHPTPLAPARPEDPARHDPRSPRRPRRVLTSTSALELTVRLA